MKYLWIFILALLLCPANFRAASAQEMEKELSVLASKLAALTKDTGKKKVTVLDFTGLQGETSELGKYIAEELTVSMVMVKDGFAVLDRANLRKIMAEHKLTSEGLVDPENAKKLGQFAGVDALILGTIIPKGQKINLTAKIISTDSAEIVGAARSEFQSDENVQRQLAQTTVAKPTGEKPKAETPKAFGDLQAKVESLKLGSKGNYFMAKLTFTISNTSATKTYGVATDYAVSKTFYLHDSLGEEFYTNNDMIGLTSVDVDGGKIYRGEFTELLPGNSLTVVMNLDRQKNGNQTSPGPHRLQGVLFFSVMENGNYPNIRKYNLVAEIK